jgi:DNA-binding beta-propeller fold protein YncE
MTMAMQRILTTIEGLTARPRLWLGLPACAIALALATAAAIPGAASATQIHHFTGSTFGTPGPAAGQLELRPPAAQLGGSSLAVDEATGNVYVADTGNHRISEFDEAGSFVRAWGWGVADGGAELQSCTLICRAGTAGSAPGQFEAPTYVAVDQGTGAVYVGDTGDGSVTKFAADGALESSWGEGGQLRQAPTREFSPLSGLATDGGELLVFGGPGFVFRFDPAGNFLSQLENPEGHSPGGLTVDGAGILYLTSGFGNVYRYDAAGVARRREVTSQLHGTPITGLSASLADDGLYVDALGTALDAYSAHCKGTGEDDTTHFFCSPFQTFGEEQLKEGGGEGAGVAVDSTDGTVYAASAGNDEVYAFPTAVEAITEAATGVTASSATLNGNVDAFGSPLTTCRFEYGEGTAEGRQSVPCEGTQAANGQVHVEAEATGLEGQATYSFRLRATNAAGDVKADEETFTTLGSPGIEAVEAVEVSAQSARLTAEINPRGSPTGYHFEWGPCEGSCPSSPYPFKAPEPDATLAGGTGFLPVSQLINGLQATTTYHFRVFAHNSLGPVTGSERTFVYLPGAPIETSCPNEALRQADGSTALPDCRAYELVTPAQKNGALIGAVLFGLRIPKISSDGQSVAVGSIQCLPSTLSCIAHRSSEGEPYEFVRSQTGWHVIPLAPPAASFQTNSWLTVSAGTGRALFTSPTEESDIFYVREPDGSFRRVGPVGNRPGASVPNTLLKMPISTTDFSTITYESQVNAWLFDEGLGSGLYQYHLDSGGEPELVGVSGGSGSTDLISACQTNLGPSGPYASALYNSVSEDGDIVWFTALECPTGTGVNLGRAVPATELYERVDSNRSIFVSTPTPVTCTTPGCEGSPSEGAQFEGASTDGSFAVFVSTQKLTDEASQDSVPRDRPASCGNTSPIASGCNLYASFCPVHCEAESERRVIDLSAGAEATGGPRVQGVVALSPDGSATYFVAKGVLTGEPNALGGQAQEGAYNLYLYRRGPSASQGSLRFVADLAAGDYPLWGGTETVQGLGLANITADGRFLVFPSHLDLTSRLSPAREEATQVYRYDADSGQMTRISIGQQGFGGDGEGAAPDAGASIVPASAAFAYGNGPARADPTLSEDGRLVLFQSPMALTPRALNERVIEEGIEAGKEGVESGRPFQIYAQNIYEWEEDGAGGCHEESGCVSLLSDGKEEIGSGTVPVGSPELLGTDTEGKNVFIAAADPLTWQDTDTQRDYYDLRVGGGFAPPAAVTPCSGDACRGLGTGPAGTAAPGTTAASGPEEGPRHLRKPKQRACKKKKGRRAASCARHKKHKSARKRHQSASGTRHGSRARDGGAR